MAVFLDTSALFAVLTAEDAAHGAALPVWKELVTSGETLVTTNYVVVETFTLLQRRASLAAAVAFSKTVVPEFQVEWVEANDHNAAVRLVVRENRRDLSLVDCASFVVMRRLDVIRVFAFDTHFAEQGFQVIPA